MSVVTSEVSVPVVVQSPPVPLFPAGRRLHRLPEVRRQEGITRRTLARRLGISMEDLRQQEQKDDLPLSTLYAWHNVLDIPVTELLVDSDISLSAPVLKRAQLLRIMKTARTILERCKQESIRRLARFLDQQLLEIMPELKEVGTWPSVGKRRSTKELGQAALRRFLASDSVQFDHGPE